MFKPVHLQIPGKLFIAGEYAVTRPNGKALVAAIESDFWISISEENEKSKLQTNVEIEDFEFLMNHIKIPLDSKWNFALTALKKTIDYAKNQNLLEEIPEFSINIQSGLGFGENKKGYGSSASVVVAVVEGVNHFLKLNLSLEKRFELAAKAHFEVQGNGSMGDIASILTGDVIFYQSPDEKFSNWKIQPQNWKSLNWTAYVAQTGKSVKTDEKLKIYLPISFYRKSDQIVEKIRKARADDGFDFSQFKALLLENQQLLIEELPPAYVTDKLKLVLEVVNAQDGLVGKISGSGFGENVIIFAENDQSLKRIKKILEKEDISLVKVTIPDEKI